jgi:hypothetical protein
MKNSFALILLFTTLSNFSQAQKWSLGGTVGLRENRNDVNVISGDVAEIEAAYLMFELNANYHLSDKWFLSSGIQLTDFSMRTVVDNGFDFNAMLQKHLMIGVPLGVNYVFLSDKKLNIEVGTGVQFLFSDLTNTVQVNGGGSFSNPQVGSNRFFKSENMTLPNTVSFLPYLRAGLTLRLLPRTSIFGNLQYSRGICPIMERTIEYSFQDEGQAIFTTNGTSIQTSFGIRFNLKEKAE